MKMFTNSSYYMLRLEGKLKYKSSRDNFHAEVGRDFILGKSIG